MHDQTDARMWAEADKGSFDIKSLIHSIMQAFRVLHRIEWSAPWQCGLPEQRCR